MSIYTSFFAKLQSLIPAKIHHKLLPPAGQNLFEKRFRHLQKLFIKNVSRETFSEKTQMSKSNVSRETIGKIESAIIQYWKK
jgi:hypothetical protein